MTSSENDRSYFSSRYEIRQLLGRGAMGKVYSVHDKTLGSEAAVKILKTGLPDHAVIRFQKEAKAAAKLRHHNILQVLDFGETDDGELFLTMEFIEGESLEDLLNKEQRLSLSESLEIFAQIAKGLEHAHKNHVLHRDLKPSNIMIEEGPGQNRTAKIVDFGLAKLEEEDQSLTSTDTRLGTPLYMSPEQCRGGKIDRRSDIYSFGCLVYKTLTGKSPFRGKSALETMRMHMEDKPKRLSDNEFGVEFETNIEELVEKLLEKDPDRRFQDFSQVLKGLSSFTSYPQAEDREQSSEDIVAQVESGSIEKSSSMLIWSFAALLSFLTVSVFAFFVLKSTDLDSFTTKPKVKPPEYIKIEKSKVDARWINIYPGATKEDVSLLSTKMFKNVKRVRILKEAISLDELDSIAKLSPSQLDLSNTKLSEKQLIRVSKISSIESLVLNGCKNITASKLKSLANLKNLIVIALRNTGISDSDLIPLAEYRKLVCLDISQNANLTPSAFVYLTKIRNLRNIFIGSTGITIDDLRKTDLYKKLSFLSLNNSGVTDSQAEVLGSGSFSALELIGNEISDKGLQAMTKNINLRFLDVRKNPAITLEGIKSVSLWGQIEYDAPGEKVGRTRSASSSKKQGGQVFDSLMYYPKVNAKGSMGPKFKRQK